MARKSRRHQEVKNDHIVASQVMKEALLPTAAYVRLSVEQETDNSIQNQSMYLKDYIEKQSDLKIHDMYIDNGFSGTDFERPEFQRMMEDVRTGQVQCIVVKDLSRFGRNFLEAGYYIETLLPILNVRLISINDDFDSSRAPDRDSISLPLRNIVNELYAKDVSKKVSKSFEAKRESGNAGIGNDIMGYTADRERKCYVINEDTAPVVQLIYRWYLRGLPMKEIAERLNCLGIPTPLMNMVRSGSRKMPERSVRWHANVVRNILENPNYTGDRYLGRTSHKKYLNQRTKIDLPREEWIIYPNSHDPIITKADSRRAVELLDVRREKRRVELQKSKRKLQDKERVLDQLVHCKECGRRMHMEIGRTFRGDVSQEASYFICRRKNQQKIEGCGQRINDNYLKSLIINQLRLFIETAVNQNDLLQEAIKTKNRNNPLWKLRNRIDNLTSREKQLSDRIIQLFADHADAILDEDDYIEMNLDFRKQRESVREELAVCKEEAQRIEGKLKHCDSQTKELKEYLKDLTLTPELVETLIERIDVGSAHQVEITFKFADIYEEALQILKGGET